MRTPHDGLTASDGTNWTVRRRASVPATDLQRADHPGRFNCDTESRDRLSCRTGGEIASRRDRWRHRQMKDESLLSSWPTCVVTRTPHR